MGTTYIHPVSPAPSYSNSFDMSDRFSPENTLRPISHEGTLPVERRPTIPSIATITTPEMKATTPFNPLSTPVHQGQMPHQTSRRGLDIATLMSPPEALSLDNSFAHAGHHGKHHNAGGSSRHDPLSPPISPLVDMEGGEGSDLDRASAAAGHATSLSAPTDPILYSRSTTTPRSSHTTLFPDQVEDKRTIDNLVSEHEARRSPGLFTVVSPPSKDHYELVVAVMSQYSKNPRAWLHNRKQELVDDQKARAAAAPRSLKTQPRTLKPQPIKQHQQHQQRHHYQHQQQRQHQQTTPAASRSGPGRNTHVRTTPVRPPPVRAAPKADRVSKRSSPRPERRQAAVTREDKNFDDLVDYTPPMSSIPNRPNCMRSEWKGSPIDLSNDKFRHLLHPEEIKLAASLRLDCATYLTSKRRIFMKRVECYERSKEFRKTDAQQACNIDVNKASRLHTAYENIGWLDSKWILRFVEDRARHRAANPTENNMLGGLPSSSTSTSPLSTAPHLHSV